MRGVNLLSILTIFLLMLPIVALVNTSCTPEPTQPPSSGPGGGGGTQENVTISGKITNYSDGWKPYATKDDVNFIYGTVASSGEPRDYSIQVPKNWGNAKVGVYHDANNNNKIDSGEESISVNITVGSENITVHFTIIPLLTISGKLVGNPTAEWKVGVTVGSWPNYEYRYGSVNTSTWDYTIKLVSNTYVVELFAFKDTNGNGSYDIGEAIARNGLSEFRLVSNIVTNINIPSLSSMTLKIGVTNNVYNLKVGAFVYSWSYGTYNLSAPTTSKDYEHTLTVESSPGDNLVVGIYYDDNNNNRLDLSQQGSHVFPLEGILEAQGIPYSAGEQKIPIHLVPQAVTGSIHYLGGASGFKPVLGRNQGIMNMMILGYGTVSGNSYEIKFYTTSNNTDLTNVDPVMFKDINNNSLFDGMTSGEPYVNWYNSYAMEFGGTFITNIKINPETPSTNIANFGILKTTVNVSLSGTDADQFKLIEGGFIGMLNNKYKSLPGSYETYTDTNRKVSHLVMFFKDDNGNNTVETVLFGGLFQNVPNVSDTIGAKFVVISNQTAVSVSETLIRAITTNIINGDYTKATNPQVVGQGFMGMSGSNPEGMVSSAVKVTSTNVVLTTYSSTSSPFFKFSVKDVGNRGFDSPNIATNSAGQYEVMIWLLTPTNITTNLMWYITNQ
ncbi:MAG: hypothetical protein ABDH28_03960 [Brevinematia bacterium]